MPDEIRSPDPLTLARYLSGEVSAGEADQVESWMAADPANRELVESLRLAWTRPEPPEFDPDDSLWKRVAARMERPLKPALAPERRARVSPRWQGWRWPRVVRPLPAAAAVFVLIAGVALLERSRRPAAPVPMREIVTQRGQRATLDLPDGSRVLLAPDSRLRLPATDGRRRAQGSARDLYLQGQAYFEVRHDSTRPFRVHTATALIEDIGTEFVVVAYPEAPTVRVAVVAGAVALRRARATAAAAQARDSAAARPLLTLTRGDLAELDSAGTAVLTRDANLDPYVSWAQGALVFDGTPLREATPVLARWYDLDVRLTDSALAGRRLTASFRGESVAQVLELIGRSLDVRVERQGRSVVLSPKGS